MGLTGIDPNDPTPSDRRELILGAGMSSAGGSSRDVMIYANKLSTGSDTAGALSTAILSGDDCIARMGRRSEAYWMYKKYVAVDPNATIYIFPVTQAGTASTVTFTFADGAATGNTALEVFCHGEMVSVSIAKDDTAIVQAAAFAAAVNAASNGEWMVTAAIGGGGSEHIVTVTTAHTGARTRFVVDRMRATYKQSIGTTCTKGSVSAGGTEDDGTSAFAAAALGECFYHVIPWCGQVYTSGGSATVTATDNQLGEIVQMVITQALPANGKEMRVIGGLVCTQAQATTIATDSDINSVWGTLYRAENNDWTPAMIAAHCAAVERSQQIAHPSANLAGYGPTDNTIFQIPAPYDINDRPTTTEIKADLNNGISPIAFTGRGSPYIVRQITTRSLNAQGSSDYRAREGHIPSAISFAWQTFKARYVSTKQPFAAGDPAQGRVPTARTTTPSAVAALLKDVIKELCSSKPLGLYDGPILAPDKEDAMKASVSATKVTAGFSISAELYAVEHNLKSETTLREVGAQY